MQQVVDNVLQFIEKCRIDSARWAFASKPNGPETLYGSTFACMLYAYLGRLDELTADEREAWAAYLNSWQDGETGLFIGPELVASELSSPNHSYEHIAHHLAAHVLPALDLLGAKPLVPLIFAYPYMEQRFLAGWLAARDFSDAWLEGNNLLFIGQFLLHLRDVENHPAAGAALKQYLDWLDEHQDPATGLWGSDGACSNEIALYGGYHQLLVYYYENHPVNYPQQLIDVALSLQHADGSFTPWGGGGACEDVDAVDILVNMYKQVPYRRPEIRLALRRALPHILSMQMKDGGFLYSANKPFIHMGIQKTASDANESNLFATWFRIHTLALMGEVLTDEPTGQLTWGFNSTCSMGWHPTWDKAANRIGRFERQEENWLLLKDSIQTTKQRATGKVRRGMRKARELLHAQ